MRRRLIAGNWKMHKTASEAAVLVRRLSELSPVTDSVEVVLAPPFTAIEAAARALPPGSPFLLAGQNLYWEDAGAFTGEVSAPMLVDLGCRYVILGHSERRRLFGDDDSGVNRKIRAALRHGLYPIVCVGESLVERDAGTAEAVVAAQLARCLEGLQEEDVRRLTLAYEPVWAIGTGRAATPVQAEGMHASLRRGLATGWGAQTGASVRVLYGGSVTPDNVGGFLASPDVDGALVGGACLDPGSFAKIIALARGRAG